MDKSKLSLTQALEAAANEKSGAAEDFFKILLESDVYVPLQKGADSEGGKESVAIVGEKKNNFLAIAYEEKECIPIFSEEEFISDWSEDEYSVIKKSFKSLIWMIPNDVWLYLNPSQEVGKELTSWELEQLRAGEGAIPELVAALKDEDFLEVEIRADEDLYPEFRRKILPIVELYPELEEAFIVALKEDEHSVEKPMVGLRWNGGNKGKKEYVKTEIEQIAKDLKAGGVEHVFVVDDLDSTKSPNNSFFEDVSPFFQRNPGAKKVNSQTLSDKLFGIFGKK